MLFTQAVADEASVADGPAAGARYKGRVGSIDVRLPTGRANKALGMQSDTVLCCPSKRKSLALKQHNKGRTGRPCEELNTCAFVVSFR
jgi:hypothetical protein